MRYYARKAFPKVQSKKICKKTKEMEYPMTEGELPNLKAEEITMVSFQAKQTVFIKRQPCKEILLYPVRKESSIQSHTL